MSLSQELNEVYELAIHMADSKKDLLNFISYFYGERSDEFWDVEFLIKSDEDLNVWFEIYDGNPDEMNTYNMVFRRWKIDQYVDNEFEEFSDLWKLDKEDFLITYFQQHGMERWIMEINMALRNGLTMEILWERHLENRYSRVEYLLYI